MKSTFGLANRNTGFGLVKTEDVFLGVFQRLFGPIPVNLRLRL